MCCEVGAASRESARVLSCLVACGLFEALGVLLNYEKVWLTSSVLKNVEPVKWQHVNTPLLYEADLIQK